ncbi:MAG TPA: alcohol dehydrogenase catalytic domain-containing protein [Frankiaceae bacterium]|nr:alcohol dehydrogenase catalytic domain-containing protein [Frankiaceae bacterium]
MRVTLSAICGTDLHLVRATMPGMQEGTILGHEAVGVIEEVGNAVRGFRKKYRERVSLPLLPALTVQALRPAERARRSPRVEPFHPAATGEHPLTPPRPHGWPNWKPTGHSRLRACDGRRYFPLARGADLVSNFSLGSDRSPPLVHGSPI